jgi:protein-tyrosine phosphatase
MSKIKVLLVCMGNICRSPTAQGVLESLVEQAALTDVILIDSAGTHAYHVGEPPDERATRAAARRGIDLSRQRARRVEAADFARFDYVLAMDSTNLDDLLHSCPDEHRAKVRLFLDFAAAGVSEVPDPYYGGPQGFERVLDLVDDAARGLLVELQRKLG